MKKQKYFLSQSRIDCARSSLKFCCLCLFPSTLEFSSACPMSKNLTLFPNSNKKFYKSSRWQPLKSSRKLLGFAALIKELSSLTKLSSMTSSYRNHHPPLKKKVRRKNKRTMWLMHRSYLSKTASMREERSATMRITATHRNNKRNLSLGWRATNFVSFSDWTKRQPTSCLALITDS